MRARPTDTRPDDPLSVLRQHLEKLPKNGLVERCQGKQCHLVLDRDAVVVSCDHSHIFDGYQGKRPDFLLASDRPATKQFCLVIVEMKSGGMKPTDLHQQLQRGADRVAESDIPIPNGSDFVPLVLRGNSGFRTADRDLLNQKRVSFRGAKRTILIERCGSSLSKIL